MDGQGIAEDIQSHSANRGQEDVQVTTRHQLRIHATGLLEQRAAQSAFTDSETLCHTRQVPNRIHRRLGDTELTARQHDGTVLFDSPQPDGLADLRQCQSRTGNRNGGPDVQATFDLRPKVIGDTMSPRVERNDPGRAGPLSVRSHLHHRMGVLEVGTGYRIQRAGGNRQGAVNRIGPAIGSDDVPVSSGGNRGNNSPPGTGVRRSPGNRVTVRLPP